MPNIGFEIAVGKQFTIAASGTYGWLKMRPWHKNIRIVTGDVGLNYWFGDDTDQVMHRGFHIGPYTAIYRYEFLFGSDGQQAKINWGAGVAVGYSMPVSPNSASTSPWDWAMSEVNIRNTTSWMTSSSASYGKPTSRDTT